MQTLSPPDVKSPSDTYLFRAPVPIDSHAAGAQKSAIAMLPAAIDVEIWQEDDGSWAAHAELLGITAVADTEPDLISEFAEQLNEFWNILNEKYETLGSDLQRLLDLRGQSFRFVKR